MRIGVLGINYKSASLCLREEVTKACYTVYEHSLLNVVLLVTCNRAEVYFSSDDLAQTHSLILQILKGAVGEVFEHSLYSYFGHECFLHLASVTSGLDSAILAENDIQRQVKISYEMAAQKKSLPSALHFLFQKSLKIGKWMRSHSSLFTGVVNFEKIVFQVAQLFLEKDRRDPKILFLGNSYINRKIIGYFKRKKMNQIALCTRDPSLAESFALDHGISVFSWDKLSQWEEADLVICGTNHSKYILSKPTGNCKTRLILDLGVPRNVDPLIGSNPQITLLNMEDLMQLKEKSSQESLKQFEKAKSDIELSVRKQLNIFLEKQQRQIA